VSKLTRWQAGVAWTLKVGVSLAAAPIGQTSGIRLPIPPVRRLGPATDTEFQVSPEPWMATGDCRRGFRPPRPLTRARRTALRAPRRSLTRPEHDTAEAKALCEIHPSV